MKKEETDNRYRRDHEMPYYPDREVINEQLRAKKAIRKYNEVMPFDEEEGLRFLDEAGIHHGEGVYFEPPFYCEYGTHITVGDNFYANTGCVILDAGKVTVGKNAQLGPRVSIFTAGHPLHPASRNSGYEYGLPIVIGDNVWIGGNSVILPGVHIGNNVVVGAGSVVTKDLPDNVCAVGNPCRVIRTIREEDKPYYYRDRKFDSYAWEKIMELQTEEIPEKTEK